MKHAAIAVLTTALITSLPLSSGAKELKKEQIRFYRPNYEETDLDIPGYEPVSKLLPTAAAADTYCIVWYDFEAMDWQGWARVDNTAQRGVFFHVDDFAGLGGGSHGRLVPIEGTKSMWCGTRPVAGFDDYLCSWESAPGYGNNWEQGIYASYAYTGAIRLSFRLVCDTESEHDLLRVQYNGWDDWIDLATFDGVADTLVEVVGYTSLVYTKIRFKFTSDESGSDQDGLTDTDGACIVDSITLADDTGVRHYEDFESYTVGETVTYKWDAYAGSGYGTYSGLASGLVDKDPCNWNYGSVIMFFNGSFYPSGEYPGLYETPYCWGSGGIEGPCQNELVVSPSIDLTRYSTGRDKVQDAAIPQGELTALGGIRMENAVYSDLPIENLVFRRHYFRSVENGCASNWVSPAIWIPYEPVGWWTSTWDISSYVTSDTIQVGLGVIDMCDQWYGVYGDCAEHTPAPWYDNVRIYRYNTSSPQWSVRRIDLFQDTFPQEVETSSNPMEEFCRADMANDIAPGDDFDRIDPGDSAVVRVSAPGSGGLDTLATGEARVYCHVNVSFLGPDGKPDLSGPQLAGTYGTYVSDDGDWTVLLCEPARSSSGHIAPDMYCIDLNDSLFTRGYMIEYYFKAYALDGSGSTYPWGAEWMPESPFFVSSGLFEFTCLPTLRTAPGVLYVDDFDGRGTFAGTVQTYVDYTFKKMFLGDCDIPDRYDVNGPSTGVSNGVGAYTSVTDASSIFCQAYEIVIFDSGDLDRYTISEGTENSDKSNDDQLLAYWMKVAEHKVGLLVMGDQIVSDLARSDAAISRQLVSAICGVTLENGSYCEMTGGLESGGIVSPIITGVQGGPFDGLFYYAFGGCPYVNSFDVLEKAGPGQYALKYPDYGGLQYYAGICTDQLNNAGQPLRTVWVGHSFMYIRNVVNGILARYEFIADVWEYFENGFHFTDSELPKATSLSNNFPNPFNPATRLNFSLKEKGHVSMRVYDVSGRLIRILVDEVREAGSYEVIWDGANSEGRKTASGIYFCRMEAGDYERTLKMVQLR